MEQRVGRTDGADVLMGQVEGKMETVDGGMKIKMEDKAR